MPKYHLMVIPKTWHDTFYSMKEVPATFRQISEKIVDVSTARKSSVLLSMDVYQYNSVNYLERSARGSGEERIIRGRVYQTS